MADDPKKIEKPASAKTPAKKDDNIVIHVMPKEYLGKVASVQEAPKPKPAPVPPPPPKPAPKPPIAQPPKKGSKLPLVLIAIGLLFIVGLGVTAYFVLESLQEEPDVIVVPDPEPEPEPDPEPEPEPEPEEPTPGQDTDSDGLTDVEEQVYGTDFRNPDSDGDTFLDGNEVFHRFDPLGFAPSTLLDTGSVEIYEDVYSMTYPKNWTVQAQDDLLAFSIPGSTADITVERVEKSVEQSIEDWYELEIAPSNGATDIVAMISKNGYQGLASSDELVTYLDTGALVFEFRYDLMEETRIEFLQTFQMMINSFEIPEDSESADETS